VMDWANSNDTEEIWHEMEIVQAIHWPPKKDKKLPCQPLISWFIIFPCSKTPQIPLWPN
jgi:hypothetical protein